MEIFFNVPRRKLLRGTNASRRQMRIAVRCMRHCTFHSAVWNISQALYILLAMVYIHTPWQAIPCSRPQGPN